MTDFLAHMPLFQNKTIGPTDLLHPSPVSYFKIFKIFTSRYSPKTEKQENKVKVKDSQLILSSIPTRCSIIQYSLLLSMLYMFQAVSPPIIRSSKLYTQHLVYAKLASCYHQCGSVGTTHPR
jgi:hypothetical protein